MTSLSGPAAQMQDQTTKLLTYLSAVAREIGPEPVRDVHKQVTAVWPGEVPDHPKVLLGPSETRDSWLTVKKVNKPAPPSLPEDLQDLIDPASIDSPDCIPTISDDLVDDWAEAKISPFRSAFEAEAEMLWEAVEKGQGVGAARQPIETALLDGVPLDRLRWIKATIKPRLDQLRLRSIKEAESALESWTSHEWAEWCIRVRPDFAVRGLYSRLYEIYLLLEGEKATLEAMWGHALISVLSGRKTINAPLVTAPVEIEIAESDGTITVTPSREPMLELDAIEGAELPGTEALQHLQAHIAQHGVDPWSAEELLSVRQKLIAPLGVNARLSSGDASITPSAAPVVNNGWALYVRKRPMRQESFYEALAEKIGDDGLVPEALASIVADNETVDRALMASGKTVEADDGSATRILMPLPANEDQERIARQLATSRGVTVQGPPGTGKSHTIVNLVSHLVAQGKRVLVTAQNEQALAVVQDKIPEAIRDFSIAVLGSTPASLEQLRISAQAMKNTLSLVDKENDTRKLEELGVEIDNSRERARRIDLDLVEALSSEQREFELAEGPTRAPDVALWVSERSHLCYISDEIEASNAFPLTVAELEELQRLARDLSPEDVKSALSELPVGDWLLDHHHIAALWGERSKLDLQLRELGEAGLQVDAFAAWSDQAINELLQTVRNAATRLGRLDFAWSDRFVHELRNHTATAAWTVEQNAVIKDKLDKLSAASSNLHQMDIEVPAGNPNVQIPLLESWKARLEQGKKLPLFGAKDLKQLADETKASGYAVTTAEQVGAAIWFVRAREIERELLHLMTEAYTHVGIPVPPAGGGFRLRAMEAHENVERLISWWNAEYPALRERLLDFFPGKDSAASVSDLELAAGSLEQLNSYRRIQAIDEELESIDTGLAGLSATPTSTDLATAFHTQNPELWRTALVERDRLLEIRAQTDLRMQLQDRLTKAGATRWARQIIHSRGDQRVVGDPENASDAWRVAQACTWLSHLHAGADVEALMTESHGIAEKIQDSITQFASISAGLKLKERMKDPQRRALETWLTAIRKVGKGTGKNAARFQAQARSALPAAMGAVPVWIMPIYRVLDNFDPKQSEMFDVVIVDESSQCDLLSLGVLALGKKTVVVGDDKQTSPVAVGVVTSRIFELQNQYLDGFKDKTLLTMDESLYSISARAFPSTILLREHFRCVPEIIEFSNRFYGGQIRPLREMTRPEIGDPVRAVHVPNAASVLSGSQRVNKREAEALVDQVIACTEDPAYDGLTFGVVTMMSGKQSNIIEAMLMERLGIDEFEKRKVRVGNPPKFQGDERNVVFLSYIADDASYAATRELAAQWANVAASRAQDQLWLFYSMDPSTLNANDYRRALIEYALDDRTKPDHEDKFELAESKFELDVMKAILDRGFDVTPQYRVGSYRIDMVINIGPGERLAIECDGDSFHGPAQWDQDVRRQRVLERLGWSFWRVRASEYYLDPEDAMSSLWARIEQAKERADRRKAVTASREASRIARRRALELESMADEGEMDPQPTPAARVEEDNFKSQQGRFEGTRVEFRSENFKSERRSEKQRPRAASRTVKAEPERIPPHPVERSANRMFVNPNKGMPSPAPSQQPSVPLHDDDDASDGAWSYQAASSVETESAVIRNWAARNGYVVNERGRIPHEVKSAYESFMQVQEVAQRVRTENAMSASSSQSNLTEVWKNGVRYRLQRDGELYRTGSEKPMSQLLGHEEASEIVRGLTEVRDSGVFRVGQDGTTVTKNSTGVLFVGKFPALFEIRE